MKKMFAICAFLFSSAAFATCGVGTHMGSQGLCLPDNVAQPQQQGQQQEAIGVGQATASPSLVNNDKNMYLSITGGPVVGIVPPASGTCVESTSRARVYKFLIGEYQEADARTFTDTTCLARFYELQRVNYVPAKLPPAKRIHPVKKAVHCGCKK